MTERGNERFAPGTDLLIAEDDEALTIAQSASNVIARHLPAGMADRGNPDLADAVAAGIVLFRYAMRQMRMWGELRRAKRAGMPTGEPQPPPPADPLAA